MSQNVTGASFEGIKNSYTQRTLNRFKEKVGTGVRPNQFEVTLKLPTKIVELAQKKGKFRQQYIEQFSDTFSFLCKSAQIPASTQGVIGVQFRGREIKIAGDKTFDNWSATVINDFDFSMRRMFEIWHSAINRPDINLGISKVEDYQCDEVVVTQLGRNGEPLRFYVLYSVWPISVQAIDMSSDSRDTIQEFTVELAVQHWDAWTPDASSANPSQSDLFFDIQDFGIRTPNIR